jgi:hypothetical protein
MVSCTSKQQSEFELEVIEEEAPRLTFDLIKDTVTHKWDIVFQWDGKEDSIHTTILSNYTFVDTANLDGDGLPEFIATRDSIYSDWGINQRGTWHYFERHQLLDVWSLDQKKLICSLVKRLDTEYSDDYQIPLYPEKSGQERQKSEKKVFEYDIHFEGRYITIANSQKDESVQTKPKYAEGTYVLKDGKLELVKSN